MRTMKLAFSVYALALALASNGAWAAGMASPSCNADTFKVSFGNNPSGCVDSGFGYVKSPGNSTFQAQTWGQGFNILSKDYYGDNCLGAELVGWTGNNLNASIHSENETYTNLLAADGGIWNSTPSADGKTEWSLNAIWEPTVTEITLNTMGADGDAQHTTKIYRGGVYLYKTEDKVGTGEFIDVQHNPINIPVRYGYSFNGYYPDEQFAADVINAWKNTNSLPAGQYCEQEVTQSMLAQWGKGSGDDYDSMMKCPWIGAHGDASNDNIGTAAAALQTTELYAGWNPQQFAVRFMEGSRAANSNDTTKPNYEDVRGDNAMLSHSTFYCRYQQRNCDMVTAPETISGTYIFSGWKVSATGEIITPEQAKTYDLSSIITKKLWQDNDNKYTNVVTLTAQWTPASTPVEFYVSKDSTTPFATYNAVIGTSDTDYSGSGEETHKIVTFFEDKNDTMTEKAALDISGITGPTSNNKSTSLRGFVIQGLSASDDLLNTVTQDSGTIAYKAYDNSKLFIVSSKDGQWNTLLDESKNALAEAIAASATENSGVAKVYGVWAENCDATNVLTENHVSSCDISISSTGQVWYINTCLPGYNIDGRDEINEDR